MNFLSQLPGQAWPGQPTIPQPGMMQNFFQGQQQMPMQTQQPPKPSFISPTMGGNLAGVAAAYATWYALSNFKMPGVAGAPSKPVDLKLKLPIALVVGWIIKKGVTKRMEDAEAKKQAAYSVSAYLYGTQAPGGQYTLPGYWNTGAIVGAPFDPDRVAGEIIQAYNPNGSNSDEYKMWETIKQVPPNQFALVATAYLNNHGRNLIADLDEQLNDWSLQWGQVQKDWTAYKEQIP